MVLVFSILKPFDTECVLEDKEALNNFESLLPIKGTMIKDGLVIFLSYFCSLGQFSKMKEFHNTISKPHCSSVKETDVKWC